jgi:hypothetical protein
MFDDLCGVKPLPAADFRDDRHDNRSIRMARGAVTYRGFTIKEKGDFGSGSGHFIRGMYVSHGYVVTDGGIINVMPAATWFLTVEDAMRAIDDLITSANMRRQTSEHPFWALHRFRANAEERAPELALLLQRVMDNKEVFYDLDDDLQQAIAYTLGRIDDNCDMRPTRGPVGGPWTRDGERVTGRFGMPL